MKRLFHSANKYLSQCDWKDLTLIKFCLFAMGVFVGAHVLEEDKKVVKFLAFTVFIATYIPLMKKFFGFLFAKREEEEIVVEKKTNPNWFEELKKDRYIRLK